jgi:hypothetical protein
MDKIKLKSSREWILSRNPKQWEINHGRRIALEEGIVSAKDLRQKHGCLMLWSSMIPRIPMALSLPDHRVKSKR